MPQKKHTGACDEIFHVFNPGNDPHFFSHCQRVRNIFQ